MTFWNSHHFASSTKGARGATVAACGISAQAMHDSESESDIITRCISRWLWRLLSSVAHQMAKPNIKNAGVSSRKRAWQGKKSCSGLELRRAFDTWTAGTATLRCWVLATRRLDSVAGRQDPASYFVPLVFRIRPRPGSSAAFLDTTPHC